MHFRKVLGILVLLGAITATGVSVWILRQPLRQTYSVLRGDSTGQGPKVRFAVIGDNHGDNPVYRQILKEVRDLPLDFVVNLADTSEFGTREEFAAIKELESILPFPVYHTVGNHDIKTDPSRRLFTDMFGQAPCASFTKENFHLILLDNADRKVGFSDDCLDWLEDDLASNTNQSIAIAYHRPFDLPLGSIVGDDETPASRITNRRFKEIIAAYPVKYIFTAHIHTYLPYSFNGIPAVVSGGGGDPAQTALGGPKNNLFHYILVTVDGDAISTEIQRVQLEAES